MAAVWLRAISIVPYNFVVCSAYIPRSWDSNNDNGSHNHVITNIAPTFVYHTRPLPNARNQSNHAGNSKHLQNGYWRLRQLDRSFSSPKHPSSPFL